MSLPALTLVALIGALIGFWALRYRRVQRELREANEHLEIFIAHAPVGIAMFDREMRYIAASRSWQVEYELGDRDLRGLRHYDVFPEIGDEWKQIHQRGLAGETVSSDGEPFKRSDGREQWIRWEVRPWRTQDGDVGGIVLLTEDVTPRRSAEEARRESEERYLAVFENAPLAMILSRLRDRRVVAANAAFCKIFEFDRDDVVGREWQELAMSDEASREAFVSKLREGGRVHELETRRKTKSGAERIVLVDAAEVALDGEAYVLTVLRDLTELRETKERLVDLDAMERLHTISSRFLREDEPSAILEEILEAAIAITESTGGALRIVDPRSGELRAAVQRGGPKDAGPHATPLVTRSGIRVGVITTAEPSPRALRLLALLARQASDLIERSRADAALRRAESKATGMLMTSADAIVAVDEMQRITLFNKSAEQIFGYTEEEALGQPLAMLLPARHREVHREHFQRFVQAPPESRGMGERRSPIHGLRKNGEEFPAEAAISNVQVDGRRHLTVALRDVTTQRRAELEERILADVGAALASTEYDAPLEAVAKALSTSVAEFVAIYELTSGGGIERRCIATRDPALVWAAEELGTRGTDGARSADTDQVLGTTVRGKPLLQQFDPDQYEAIARSPRHLEAIRAVSPRSALFVPMLASGVCIGVLAMASASRALDERDVHFVEEVARRCAFFIENARLHRAERRAVKARNDVLGIVAHDLRSPLSALLMQASLMKRRPGGLPDRRDPSNVDLIQRTVRRMNRIIDDLLDVSRIDAGQLEIERRRVTAGALLGEIVESHRPKFEERKLELRCEFPPELGEVWADRDRVHQVFENLIGNAMKFTNEGSITIGAERRAGDVRFWVRDTGLGIAPQDLPNVFDRFWQAERRRGGAGLGLAIVKGIVEAHGGSIDAASELGVGTTFTFCIPSAPRTVHSVLVADDDPSTREVMARVLEDQGYAVVAVANGREALDRMHQASPPELVILDLVMPVLDGWGFLAERAHEKSLGDVPVIVVSGEQDVTRQVEVRNATFVPKPLSPDRLLAAVGAVERAM